MEQQVMPTPASQWSGKVAVEGTDLPLPSGNVARVRQIDPQAFIGSDLIPDPLSAIIRQAINSKQGLPPSAIKKVSEDKELLADTLLLFDRVLAYVLIEPHCELPPTCVECGEYFMNGPHRDRKNDSYHAYQEGAREGDVLYTDQVVLDDKMFVFQWCLGGTRDLEKFRGQLKSGLGDVPHGKNIQGKAKRSTSRK